jgi:hypothetical protein
MKKLIIAIASVAVLSTAAHAGKGADNNVPAFENQFKRGSLHPVSKKLITKFALSHKAMMRVVATPNYINMSQLR